MLPRVVRGADMVKLQWLASYAVGHEKIDQDHKALIAIMTDVQASVDDGDRPRCSMLLQDLIVLAQDHFRDEEEILQSLDYPKLAAHKSYHDELLLKVEAMRAICEEAPTEGRLEKCSTTMAEFLIDDIIVGDLQFKSFLQEKR